MSTETKTPEIYLALAAIMKDCEPIAKAEENKGQGFFFRGIQTVMNELHPIFAAKGVVCIPNVKHTEHRDAGITKNHVVQTRAIVTCGFIFLATDGSHFEAVTIGEGLDAGDKATGKAMSMALKYALTQTFLIPTEDVVEADYYDPTVDVSAKIALQNRDRPRIQKMIDERIANANRLLEEAAEDRELAKKAANREGRESLETSARDREIRAKELQGKAEELRAELAELDVSQGQAPTPPPEPPNPITAPTQMAQQRVEPAAAPAQPKPQPPVEPKPNPTFTGWQDVICHLGKAGGSAFGKRIGDMIEMKNSKKHVEDLVAWFFKKLGDNPAQEQDRILLQAVVAAHDAWKAHNDPSGDPELAKKPQADPTDWRAHRIVSTSDKTINGIALGTMTLDEIVKLDQRMDKIDWSRATSYQKQLRALLALAKADLQKPTKPQNHTTDLLVALDDSQIPHDGFIQIGVKAGWFPDTTKTIEEIDQASAEAILSDWETIMTCCSAPV